MKKILVSAIALVLGVTAMNAQGPWFLGGEVGFLTGKDDAKNSYTGFSINPQVGYMLNDNWGLMLDLGYRTESEKPDGGESTTFENAFGVGVSAIYKLQIVDKFFYAPTIRVGFENESKAEETRIEADLTFLRFELRPSCNWGINFNFGGLGYLNTKVKDADNSASEFGLYVGDAFAVGFTYYF